MKNKYSNEEIIAKAKNIRQNIIYTNVTAGQGHTGSDLSVADILAALYFGVLNIDKDNLDDPNRDRLILSKGHAVCGLYCTLVEYGILKKADLDSYLKFESKLPGHPVRQKTPGIELNTGALGHGLPVAVGLAKSAKMLGLDYRVFVITGDGELQEGSNWEAALSASQFELDNLYVIVDRNKLQLADWTRNIVSLKSLEEKWKAFRFDVHETNGNDVGAIINTINSIDSNNQKPHVIIAHTTKGKGVSFIENNPLWHHKIPAGDEIPRAIEELE
ncbi:MAG: transketolase [Melioribacteraceae bacterium]|nr:transketolase [Melioribacteraceae bacterium]